jgi:diguanylate cyclase (GGDEF)-like protein/PAS domain S-box-containing protein
MADRQAPRNVPQQALLAALEAAGEGIALVDGEHPDRPVVWVNSAMERISGFERKALIGSNLRVLQGGDREQPGLAELRAALQEQRSCSVLLRNYRPDGALYWNELRIEPWRDGHGGLWWLGFARDVSAQREMEIMLGRRADELDAAQRRIEEIDPVDRLTGLQSERSFELALELSWFSCARDRRPLALFLFAPDYFDVYLETFGRVAGDSCLRMLARGVGGLFRRATDVVGRLGDAHFGAVATDMDFTLLEPHARRVCERVRALAIRNPHAPQGRSLTLSAAVLQASPGRTSDWRELLTVARESLAKAQSDGVEQLVVRDYGVDSTEAGG